MLNSRSWLVIVWFCLFATKPICSQENEQTSIVINEKEPTQKFIMLAALEFPPLAYSEAGSLECIGYIIQLTRQIFEKYGFEVRTVCAPAVRVYRMIKNGEVDLTVNIRSTKLLNEHVDFFDTPYGNLELIFLSHKDKGFEKLVSGIRGFDYHGHRQLLIERGFAFQDTPGSIDAIRLFVRERTRHLITYKGPYKFYLENNGFNMPIETHIEFLESLPTFYAVAKSSKHREFILEKLQQQIDESQVSSFDQLMPFY